MTYDHAREVDQHRQAHPFGATGGILNTPLPLTIDALSADIDIQTKTPIDLDLPLLPYDVEIDLGTMHLPAFIQGNEILLDTHNPIIQDTASISIGLDTSS